MSRGITVENIVDIIDAIRQNMEMHFTLKFKMPSERTDFVAYEARGYKQG